MTDVPSTSTIIDGRYRVLGRIGSGGMADVVCAEDLQLGRKVAIKLLHRRFAADAEFVERFRREASSAAGLQHPNVVAVYDRGEWDGTYYIAMEFLQGRSLKRVVQEEAPLDPARAVDLTIQVLRAARFAHKRGIIHRDLKPHNVLLEDGAEPQRAKVTDFGIARAGASDMTQTGSIMGTAQYLSPEQAQGHPVSAASDLYSIGIILYEMLTGRVPFEGESAVAIALKQVNEAPVPPSHYNAAVSPALEAVVLRSMEKDPARRFADADEFMAALEGAMAGVAPATAATVAATPPTAIPDATQVVAPAGGFVPIPPPNPYQEVAHVEYPPPLPPDAVPGGEDDGGRGWWIALLVGLVVAGAIVAGLLLFNQEKVLVPNVVGVPQAEAQVTLKHKGLSSDVTQKESATVPKGTVMGQDPGAGSHVKKGEVITLVVSTGPGTAQIPDVRGQPRSQAIKKLEGLGFDVTEERQPDDTIGQNRAIETRPGAGTDLEKGQTVVLVVSSGKQRVAVPKVKGMTEDDARSALEALGFQVDTKQQVDDSVDPGTVLSADPAEGTSIPKGSTVTLTVAKPSDKVDVPKVKGQPEDQAIQTLSSAGFAVHPVDQTVDNPSQDGQVLDQSPSGGKAKKGSKVTITVGRYQPGSSTTGGTTPSTPAPSGPGA